MSLQKIEMNKIFFKKNARNISKVESYTVKTTLTGKGNVPVLYTLRPLRGKNDQ